MPSDERDFTRCELPDRSGPLRFFVETFDMVDVYWFSRRRFPCHIEEREDREDNSPNRQKPKF